MFICDSIKYYREYFSLLFFIHIGSNEVIEIIYRVLVSKLIFFQSLQPRGRVLFFKKI